MNHSLCFTGAQTSGHGRDKLLTPTPPDTSVSDVSSWDQQPGALGLPHLELTGRCLSAAPRGSYGKITSHPPHAHGPAIGLSSGSLLTDLANVLGFSLFRLAARKYDSGDELRTQGCPFPLNQLFHTKALLFIFPLPSRELLL